MVHLLAPNPIKIYCDSAFVVLGTAVINQAKQKFKNGQNYQFSAEFSQLSVVERLGKLSGGKPGILYKSWRPVFPLVLLKDGKFKGGRLRLGKFNPAMLLGIVVFGVLWSPAAPLELGKPLL